MNRTTRRTLSIAIASVFAAQGLTARYGGLAIEVDNLEGVPEAARPFYKQDDTTKKYRLDVSGVEDVSGLKASLAAAREDAKKERAERVKLADLYKDVDPAKYRKLMEQIEGDEELRLLAEGKHKEAWDKRTERLRAQHAKELEEAGKLTKAEQERANKYRSKVLENAIRSAAGDAGVHKHAMRDALAHGTSVFTLDEDGNAVRLDNDGKPVYGKDGKTPYSPLEWLEEQKETSPHWFPSLSSGGGAGGDKGGQGNGKTMKRADFDRLDAAAKHKYTTVDKGVVVD